MDYRKNEDMICDDARRWVVSYNQILSVTAAVIITYPVTLAEVKNFAKIDVPDDDVLIEETLIPAAVEMCEQLTNISFVAREITTAFNNCNGGTFLPYGPVAEDVSLSDIDAIDITDPSQTKGQWKQVLTPKNDYMVATYTGGYDVLPAKLKTALLNAIYYLYDHRAQGVDNVGPIAMMILNPLKRV